MNGNNIEIPIMSCFSRVVISDVTIDKDEAREATL
jgi:hypothetical protein